MPRDAVRPVGAFGGRSPLLLGWAGAAAPPAEAVSAIPEGQEPVLTRMLNSAAASSGGCKWDDASIERTFAKVRFVCAGPRTFSVTLFAPGSIESPAARTAKFDVVIDANQPPPTGFTPALAESLRRGESDWRWVVVAGHAPPEPPPRPTAWIGTLALIACLLGVVVAAMRLARRADATVSAGAAPPADHRVSGRHKAVLVGAALVVPIALRFGLQGLGGALVLVWEQRAVSAIALAALELFVCSAALAWSLTVILRSPLSKARRAVLLACLCAAASLGWVAKLGRTKAEPVDGPLRCPPSSALEERSPLRPKLTYHTNAQGFRGADFNPTKEGGTVRGAILGDSYAFGVGVPDGETLGEALSASLGRRHPERRFELLNLGVPGNNLKSHVGMYAYAEALQPDFVVLCLTLPNDLSDWDQEDARRQEGRASVFGWSSHMVGHSAASMLFDLALLERATTPAGLRLLDAELARLARLRAHPAAPPIVVFTYGYSELSVRDRLERAPGVLLAPVVLLAPEDSIPGDGHPTGIGNRRFAEVLADRLEGVLPGRGSAQEPGR